MSEDIRQYSGQTAPGLYWGYMSVGTYASAYLVRIDEAGGRDACYQIDFLGVVSASEAKRWLLALRHEAEREMTMRACTHVFMAGW